MKFSFNKTKVIATVGPASSTREQILELMVAGVDVFRLNFSHGSYEDHKKVLDTIRELNHKFEFNVCILQDLQGPKIRVGDIEGGQIELIKGEKIRITTDKGVMGTKQRISCAYEDFVRDVKIGEPILMDDGKLELVVSEKDQNDVIAKVIVGGILKPRKGINLPNTNVSAPSMTEKDLKDVMFGIENEVEWVALSFVRNASDMIRLKEIITQHNSNMRTVAKIERPEAVANIDSIIEEADALMVARGDLGVEINAEEVPVVQKRIVRKCNEAAKPVIIATQMMESMIENPRPTRAETNDVANAVMDGADALMLSGETAVGKYPVEVIKSMVKTISSIEVNVDSIYHHYYPLPASMIDYTSKSVITTACRLAQNVHAKALISMTQSGYTAFQLASHRPKAGVFIFTSNNNLLTTLNLVWGVRGYYYDKFVSTDQTFKDTQEILFEKGHIQKGDLFVNTASMPIDEKQRTNVLKLSKME